MFVSNVRVVRIVKNVGKGSLKVKREKRKNEQNSKNTIERDMKEAIRIKGGQSGNHGRIGQNED